MKFQYTLLVSPGPDGKLHVAESIDVPAGETVTVGDVVDVLIQRAAGLMQHGRTKRLVTLPEREALRPPQAENSEA